MAVRDIPLLQTGGGKGVLGRIATVVLRGTTFHFRRAGPLDLCRRLRQRRSPAASPPAGPSGGARVPRAV